MAFFLVELPADRGGQTLVDGVRAGVVEADSAAEAKELMAARSGSDGNWVDASVTAVDVTTLSAANMEGWTYRVTVRDPAVGGEPGVVETVDVVGTATEADADAVAALLVTALNALPSIGAASYSTPTLTVAGIADNLGDQSLQVEVFPPDADASMPAMVGAIVDEGLVAAALTAVLTVPTAIPVIAKLCK